MDETSTMDPKPQVSQGKYSPPANRPNTIHTTQPMHISSSYAQTLTPCNIFTVGQPPQPPFIGAVPLLALPMDSTPINNLFSNNLNMTGYSISPERPLSPKSVRQSTQVSRYTFAHPLDDRRPLDHSCSTHPIHGSFIRSLKKYNNDPKRTTSADLIERLIAYTQAKNLIKSCNHSKGLRCVKRQSRIIQKPALIKHSCKNIQTYTRTRTESPPSHLQNNSICGKVERRRRISPASSPTRQRCQTASYDYLKIGSQHRNYRNSDIRYLNDVTKFVKETLRNIYDDEDQVCPRIANRYRQHVKSRHNIDAATHTVLEQEKMVQTVCSPLESYSGVAPKKTLWKSVYFNTCPPSSCCDHLMAIPYPLEYDDDECMCLDIIDDVVTEWLKRVPISAYEGSRIDIDEMKNCIKENIIKYKDDDKLEAEVIESLNVMPLWLPLDKKDQETFKRDLAAQLLDGLYKDSKFRDKVKRTVGNWLKTVPLKPNPPIDKKKCITILADKLIPCCEEEPVNMQQEVKDKVLEELVEWPIEYSDSNVDQNLAALAENLTSDLTKLKTNQTIYNAMRKLGNHVNSEDELDFERILKEISTTTDPNTLNELKETAFRMLENFAISKNKREALKQLVDDLHNPIRKDVENKVNEIAVNENKNSDLIPKNASEPIEDDRVIQEITKIYTDFKCKGYNDDQARQKTRPTAIDLLEDNYVRRRKTFHPKLAMNQVEDLLQKLSESHEVPSALTKFKKKDELLVDLNESAAEEINSEIYSDCEGDCSNLTPEIALEPKSDEELVQDITKIFYDMKSRGLNDDQARKQTFPIAMDLLEKTYAMREQSFYSELAKKEVEDLLDTLTDSGQVISSPLILGKTAAQNKDIGICSSCKGNDPEKNFDTKSKGFSKNNALNEMKTLPKAKSQGKNFNPDSTVKQEEGLVDNLFDTAGVSSLRTKDGKRLSMEIVKELTKMYTELKAQDLNEDEIKKRIAKKIQELELVNKYDKTLKSKESSFASHKRLKKSEHRPKEKDMNEKIPEHIGKICEKERGNKTVSADKLPSKSTSVKRLSPELVEEFSKICLKLKDLDEEDEDDDMPCNKKKCNSSDSSSGDKKRPEKKYVHSRIFEQEKDNRYEKTPKYKSNSVVKERCHKKISDKRTSRTSTGNRFSTELVEELSKMYSEIKAQDLDEIKTKEQIAKKLKELNLFTELHDKPLGGIILKSNEESFVSKKRSENKYKHSPTAQNVTNNWSENLSEDKTRSFEEERENKSSSDIDELPHVMVEKLSKIGLGLKSESLNEDELNKQMATKMKEFSLRNKNQDMTKTCKCSSTNEKRYEDLTTHQPENNNRYKNTADRDFNSRKPEHNKENKLTIERSSREQKQLKNKYEQPTTQQKEKDENSSEFKSSESEHEMRSEILSDIDKLSSQTSVGSEVCTELVEEFEKICKELKSQGLGKEEIKKQFKNTIEELKLQENNLTPLDIDIMKPNESSADEPRIENKYEPSSKQQLKEDSRDKNSSEFKTRKSKNNNIDKHISKTYDKNRLSVEQGEEFSKMRMQLKAQGLDGDDTKGKIPNKMKESGLLDNIEKSGETEQTCNDYSSLRLQKEKDSRYAVATKCKSCKFCESEDKNNIDKLSSRTNDKNTVPLEQQKSNTKYEDAGTEQENSDLNDKQKSTSELQPNKSENIDEKMTDINKHSGQIIASNICTDLVEKFDKICMELKARGVDEDDIKVQMTNMMNELKSLDKINKPLDSDIKSSAGIKKLSTNKYESTTTRNENAPDNYGSSIDKREGKQISDRVPTELVGDVNETRQELQEQVLGEVETKGPIENKMKESGTQVKIEQSSESEQKRLDKNYKHLPPETQEKNNIKSTCREEKQVDKKETDCLSMGCKMCVELETQGLDRDKIQEQIVNMRDKNVDSAFNSEGRLDPKSSEKEKRFDTKKPSLGDKTTKEKREDDPSLTDILSKTPSEQMKYLDDIQNKLKAQGLDDDEKQIAVIAEIQKDLEAQGKKLDPTTRKMLQRKLETGSKKSTFDKVNEGGKVTKDIIVNRFNNLAAGTSLEQRKSQKVSGELVNTRRNLQGSEISENFDEDDGGLELEKLVIRFFKLNKRSFCKKISIKKLLGSDYLLTEKGSSDKLLCFVDKNTNDPPKLLVNKIFTSISNIPEFCSSSSPRIKENENFSYELAKQLIEAICNKLDYNDIKLHLFKLVKTQLDKNLKEKEKYLNSETKFTIINKVLDNVVDIFAFKSQIIEEQGDKLKINNLVVDFKDSANMLNLKELQSNSISVKKSRNKIVTELLDTVHSAFEKNHDQLSISKQEKVLATNGFNSSVTQPLENSTIKSFSLLQAFQTRVSIWMEEILEMVIASLPDREETEETSRSLALKLVELQSKGINDPEVQNEMLMVIKDELNSIIEKHKLYTNVRCKSFLAYKLLYEIIALAKAEEEELHREDVLHDISSAVLGNQSQISQIWIWFSRIQMLSADKTGDNIGMVDKLNRKLEKIQKKTINYEVKVKEMEVVIDEWLNEALLQKGLTLDAQTINTFSKNLIDIINAIPCKEINSSDNDVSVITTRETDAKEPINDHKKYHSNANNQTEINVSSVSLRNLLSSDFHSEVKLSSLGRKIYLFSEGKTTKFNGKKKCVESLQGAKLSQNLKRSHLERQPSGHFLEAIEEVAGSSTSDKSIVNLDKTKKSPKIIPETTQHKMSDIIAKNIDTITSPRCNEIKKQLYELLENEVALNHDEAVDLIETTIRKVQFKFIDWENLEMELLALIREEFKEIIDRFYLPKERKAELESYLADIGLKTLIQNRIHIETKQKQKILTTIQTIGNLTISQAEDFLNGIEDSIKAMALSPTVVKWVEYILTKTHKQQWPLKLQCELEKRGYNIVKEFLTSKIKSEKLSKTENNQDTKELIIDDVTRTVIGNMVTMLAEQEDQTIENRTLLKDEITQALQKLSVKTNANELTQELLNELKYINRQVAQRTLTKAEPVLNSFYKTYLINVVSDKSEARISSSTPKGSKSAQNQAKRDSEPRLSSSTPKVSISEPSQGRRDSEFQKNQQQYEESLQNVINNWINETPEVADHESIQDETLKKTMIDDLTWSIVDTEKYYQVNPDLLVPEPEAVDNLKYQCNRWLAKFLEGDDQSAAMSKIDDLIKEVRGLEVPTLTAAGRSSISASSSEVRTYEDGLQDSILSWIEGLPPSNSTTIGGDHLSKVAREFAQRVHKLEGTPDAEPEFKKKIDTFLPILFGSNDKEELEKLTNLFFDHMKLKGFVDFTWSSDSEQSGFDQKLLSLVKMMPLYLSCSPQDRTEIEETASEMAQSVNNMLQKASNEKSIQNEMVKHLKKLCDDPDLKNDEQVLKNAGEMLLNNLKQPKQDDSATSINLLTVAVNQWVNMVIDQERAIDDQKHIDKAKKDLISRLKNIRQQYHPSSFQHEDSIKVEIQSFLQTMMSSRSCCASVPNNLHESVMDLVKILRFVPLQPKDKASIKPFKRPADILYEYVDDWCDNLPLEEGSDTERATKKNLAIKLINRLGELNMNPDIFNDSILYEDLLQDEIDKLIKDVPKNPELEKYLPALKKDLVSKIMQARDKMYSELLGKAYKQQLRDTISTSFGLPDNLSPDEQASFELLKDKVADAFINLHYAPSSLNESVRNGYKQSIFDEIDRFCGEVLRRYPCTNFNPDQIKKNLHKALVMIPIPKDDSMKSEVEQARIKQIINEWMKDVPLRKETATERLRRHKLTTVLADHLHEEEMIKETDPYVDRDDKSIDEITKFLQKLNLIQGQEMWIPDLVQSLMNKLANSMQSRKFISARHTKSSECQVCTKYPCTLTQADKDHMIQIRERANNTQCGKYANPSSKSNCTQTEQPCCPVKLPPVNKDVQCMPKKDPHPMCPKILVREFMWDNRNTSVSTHIPKYASKSVQPCCSSSSQCPQHQNMGTQPYTPHQTYQSFPSPGSCLNEPSPKYDSYPQAQTWSNRQEQTTSPAYPTSQWGQPYPALNTSHNQGTQYADSQQAARHSSTLNYSRNTATQHQNHCGMQNQTQYTSPSSSNTFQNGNASCFQPASRDSDTGVEDIGYNKRCSGGRPSTGQRFSCRKECDRFKADPMARSRQEIPSELSEDEMWGGCQKHRNRHSRDGSPSPKKQDKGDDTKCKCKERILVSCKGVGNEDKNRFHDLCQNCGRSCPHPTVIFFKRDQ